MSQTLLTAFYKRTNVVKQNTFMNFVYYPNDLKSCFQTDEPDTKCAKFICSADKIRLWVYSSKSNFLQANTFDLPTSNYTVKEVPLLISQLQKAIRLKKKQSALLTVISLLLLDKNALLRRLPIIAIEDVDLILGTSIIVWFMMVGNNYQLTERDVRIILGYVSNLCEINTYVEYDRNNKKDYEINHKTISELNCEKHTNDYIKDELFALYYRTLWGGTKGDMNMLRSVLRTYCSKELQVKREIKLFDDEIPEQLAINLDNPMFLPQAIDFHCYPWILKKISTQTKFDENKIKELIWNCQSSLNVRKIDTQENAVKICKDYNYEYKRINNELDKLRVWIVNKINL